MARGSGVERVIETNLMCSGQARQSPERAVSAAARIWRLPCRYESHSLGSSPLAQLFRPWLSLLSLATKAGATFLSLQMTTAPQLTWLVLAGNGRSNLPEPIAKIHIAQL